MDPSEGRGIGRKHKTLTGIYSKIKWRMKERKRKIKVNIGRRRRDDYECLNKGGFGPTGLA